MLTDFFCPFTPKAMEEKESVIHKVHWDVTKKANGRSAAFLREHICCPSMKDFILLCPETAAQIIH